MYQVNYNGLRRRDTYDEIVAILEHDTTLLQYPDRVKGKKRRFPIPDEFNAKIKYPNRVANQILNSPYMKQLDGQTLLDMQNQQNRLEKEKLKDLVLKSIAESTGQPFSHLKALHAPAKSEAVVQAAQKQLRDIAVGEDDIEDFRSVAGSELQERERLEAEKKNAMAQAVAEMHSKGVGASPIHYASAAVQHKYGEKDKATEMTPFRFEAEPWEWAAENARLRDENEMIRKQIRWQQYTERRDKDRERTKQHRQKVPSGSSVSRLVEKAANMMKAGASWGLGKDVEQSEEEAYSPPQGSKSRDGSAKTSRAASTPPSVKRESEAGTPTVPAGYAQPVGVSNLSRTPSQSGRSTKREKTPRQSNPSSGQSGMAQPVTPGSGRSTPAALRTPSGRGTGRSSGSGRGSGRGSGSAASYSVGTAVAASSASSRPQVYTIHSSPEQTPTPKRRGRPHRTP